MARKLLLAAFTALAIASGVAAVVAETADQRSSQYFADWEWMPH